MFKKIRFTTTNGTTLLPISKPVYTILDPSKKTIRLSTQKPLGAHWFHLNKEALYFADSLAQKTSYQIEDTTN